MIDTVLILILIFAMIYGSIKGFMSIVEPIVAFLISIFLTPMTNIFLLKYISFYEEKLIFKILLFLIIYAISRFLISILKTNLKKILHTIYLGWVDHLLGAISSVIVASILILLVLTFITEFTGKTFNSNVVFYIKDFKNLII